MYKILYIGGSDKYEIFSERCVERNYIFSVTFLCHTFFNFCFWGKECGFHDRWEVLGENDWAYWNLHHLCSLKGYKPAFGEHKK